MILAGKIRGIPDSPLRTKSWLGGVNIELYIHIA